MAKNTLFLLHGVGRHGDDWADGPDGPIAALEAASLRYAFFREQKAKGNGLRQLVDIVPIRYDDLFTRILEQWQDMAAGLRGLPGAPEALEAALGLMEKASNEKETFVAFGGDVPLYRGFRLFAQRVQLRVILRMAEVIAAKDPAAGGTFSVMAHSLGTTVAHDALQLMGSTDWLSAEVEGGPAGAATDAASYKKAHAALAKVKQGVLNPFAPGNTSFQSVYMLSNTSPLLQTTKAPEDSIVGPVKTAGAARAYCDRFYNVDHTLDPISKVRPFKMPKAWTEHEGIDLVVDHFHDLNVHAYTHYLLHPKVHRELFFDVIDGFEATDEEVARDEAFERFGGKVAALAEDGKARLRQKLDGFIAEATAPARKELARVLAAKQAIEELAAAGI